MTTLPRRAVLLLPLLIVACGEDGAANGTGLSVTPTSATTATMVSRSPQAAEQTTTTFGPTTTVDREALNATWALSGSWLIHDSGVNDADIQGFAAFNPQVSNDRFVSTGHGPCFLFGGRAVETDGMTQVVPIEDASEPAVECDPGPATDTYSQVVECLQAGCQLDLAGDVLRLSTGTGQRVADLIRTTNEIPPW